MIDAGKLNRRLTLRPVVRTENGLNELVETWPDGPTVWAGKSDVSDGERVSAAQVGATITARFLVRFSAAAAALGSKDRVYLHPIRSGEAGREYEVEIVKAADSDGLEISATARVG